MNELITYRRDIYSQSGEDGIIERIFSLIEPENKWCVELGALNGVHHSNTHHLITKKGWSGVLIEPDETYFERLQKTYLNTPGVHCVNTFIDFSPKHSLDAVLAQTPIPRDFDLLSLDIDGNDYHVWESMARYEPRVVIIESNPSIPNDLSFIQPRDMAVQQGSSARAIVELGERKGYSLCTVAGCNLFFIRKDLFPKLGIPAHTLDELNTGTACFTRLFQLYDGTLVLDGCQRLLWHGQDIDPEMIQVLRKSKRRYIAGTSSLPAVRKLKYWVRRMPLYDSLRRIRQTLDRT